MADPESGVGSKAKLIGSPPTEVPFPFLTLVPGLKLGETRPHKMMSIRVSKCNGFALALKDH